VILYQHLALINHTKSDVDFDIIFYADFCLH
jgi:hypothetical protein